MSNVLELMQKMIDEGNCSRANDLTQQIIMSTVNIKSCLTQLEDLAKMNKDVKLDEIKDSLNQFLTEVK